MAHASRDRVMEMSSRPCSMRARISLRRVAGCRNSGRSSNSRPRNPRYRDNRKNQLRSCVHCSSRVGWITHLPSAISFSRLKSSQPTQYQPSYVFS